MAYNPRLYWACVTVFAYRLVSLFLVDGFIGWWAARMFATLSLAILVWVFCLTRPGSLISCTDISRSAASRVLAIRFGPFRSSLLKWPVCKSD